MANGVAGAVQTRRLAVPERKHAIDACAGEKTHLLRAPDGRGGQVLVDSRLKDHATSRQLLGATPKLPIEAADGGAAIARDVALGVEARTRIESPLIKRQPRQRMDAGQERHARFQRVAIIQRKFSFRHVFDLRHFARTPLCKYTLNATPLTRLLRAGFSAGFTLRN